MHRLIAIAAVLVRRVRARLFHVALAGGVKWGAAIGLAAYLKAHGHRPVWALVIGLVLGAAILVSALWPSGPTPPVHGPPAA